MKHNKIMSLLKLFLVYLFQVEIIGWRMEFHATAMGYGTSVRRRASSPSHENDALDSHYILMLPSARKSEFVVLNNFSRAALNIKGRDGRPNLVSLTQFDSFKPNHPIKGFSQKNFPSSESTHIVPLDLPTQPMSRSFANESNKTAKSKQNTEILDMEFPKNKAKQPAGQIISMARGRFYISPSQLQHSVVKRSNDNDLFDGVSGGHKGYLHRTPKMRIAGLKVSDFGLPTELYCPALPVTTRTIVTCNNGRQIGSKCFLRCASGFVLAGNRRSRRCRIKNRPGKKASFNNVPYWSGKQSDYQCVPSCKSPMDPEHGVNNCQKVYLSTGWVFQCKTECNRGFRIVGNSFRTCLEHGHWSGDPASCKAASTRHTKKYRFKFQEHQSLHCGEVYSLASFRKDDVVYLVAGDKAGNVVRIYRWDDGKFDETPCQTIYFPAPETVEVLTAPDGTIWLMVAGSAPVTLYRLHTNGRFQRSHTTSIFDSTMIHKQDSDTIGFAELRGEFYRCYGRNRRETPVIVVHKLQDTHVSGSRGDVFRRIMRKKLPGEKVHQCSMYSEGNSLYTVVTLNKQDGSGRIMIGHLTKKRMKIVDVVSGDNLWKVSDSFGFTVERERFIVVSQAVKNNGRCLVYKRYWRNRTPVETG